MIRNYEVKWEKGTRDTKSLNLLILAHNKTIQSTLSKVFKQFNIGILKVPELVPNNILKYPKKSIIFSFSNVMKIPQNFHLLFTNAVFQVIIKSRLWTTIKLYIILNLLTSFSLKIYSSTSRVSLDHLDTFLSSRV